MFDIKSQEFLGGQNVQSIIIIGMLGFVVWKMTKGAS